MKKKFVHLFLLITLFTYTGCENAVETLLVGGQDVPYGKIGMSIFPDNIVTGSLPSQMADIKSLKVNYVRMDLPFDENYMASAFSARDFSRFDKYVSAANGAGLDIVVILAYVPNWLKGNPGWKSVYINNYVIPVVKRYKGVVKNWEVWNEPDSFTKGVLDGSPEDYFDLLKRASKAIRSIDPSATVVSAATTSIVLDGLGKWNWTQDLIDMGLSQWADVLNFHYYSELDPELSALGGNMVRNAGMRVWVTETGEKGQSNQESYFKTVMAYIDKSLNPER
ncbi:hypothetical protein MNBD_NITROSPINAE04-2495, partial [hydrothermal vent metagenome]